jgi:hypothetical protein
MLKNEKKDATIEDSKIFPAVSYYRVSMTKD